MKIYGRTFLKCAFLGLFILDPTLISAMDTITIKTRAGKRQVKLNELPQWLLDSESKSNPDPHKRKIALQILTIRNQISHSSLSSSNSSKTDTSQLSSDFSLQSSSSQSSSSKLP